LKSLGDHHFFIFALTFFSRRNGCDMEALRISELESILAQHDKIRNRNRHLNDLAQLLNAAVNTFDNFKEED